MKRYRVYSLLRDSQAVAASDNPDVCKVTAESIVDLFTEQGKSEVLEVRDTVNGGRLHLVSNVESRG